MVLGALINRPSRLVCEVIVVVLVAISSCVQNPPIPALHHLLRMPPTSDKPDGGEETAAADLLSIEIEATASLALLALGPHFTRVSWRPNLAFRAFTYASVRIFSSLSRRKTTKN